MSAEGWDEEEFQNVLAFIRAEFQFEIAPWQEDVMRRLVRDGSVTEWSGRAWARS
jgi:hypothetical protein